jgi:hypothetical protein
MREIVDKLSGINRTLERILAVMEKPKSRFVQVLEVFGLCVGSLGILHIIELVKSWIVGG